MPSPFRILFVCQGGLNRSVLAAAMAPGVFAEKGACVQADAAAAFPGTEGHGLPAVIRELVAPLTAFPADAYTVKPLTDALAAGYDYVCFLDRDAATYRMHTLHFPQDRMCLLHVPDPAYSGHYDEAAADITGKLRLLHTLLRQDGLL